MVQMTEAHELSQPTIVPFPLTHLSASGQGVKGKVNWAALGIHTGGSGRTPRRFVIH